MTRATGLYASILRPGGPRLERLRWAGMDASNAILGL